jgi:hypothetical protein
MATNNIPILTGSIKSDTNATANTFVERDNAGGIYGTNVSGSALITTGTFQGSVALVTTTYTAGTATFIFADATSAAFTITMPTASAFTGTMFKIWKVDSAHTITLSGTTGVTSLTTAHAWTTIISDGTNWNAG